MVAAAVIGAAVVGGVASADSSRKAAHSAADAQRDAAQGGIDETRTQFDRVQSLLKPYVAAGNNSLAAQQDLNGLNGAGAQQAAISALQSSPQFTSLLQQGENSILQNASATGGLRGGNVQGALGQFRPQLLAQTINDQYARLGGMTSIGQNAAAGVGNAGMATGGAVSGLLQQQGAATAGAALASGRANAGVYNSIANGIGQYGANYQANNGVPSSYMGGLSYGDYASAF